MQLFFIYVITSEKLEALLQKYKKQSYVKDLYDFICSFVTFTFIAKEQCCCGLHGY
jgi:hypothetical protein